MRKTAFLMATLVAASMLGAAPVHAKDDRSAKIKRLQAEQRMADANAQAAAETTAAYEEAWKKTKTVAKDAVCAAATLYSGPVGALTCFGASIGRKR
jgi:hypothetical protein